MRPVPGEVLHFSEDPTIARFRPHVAATARESQPYVWAVNAAQAPAYWFPRDCPRVMAWPGPRSTPGDIARIIGPGGGSRVHAVEFGWLERIRTTPLYAYRLPAAAFRPFGAPDADEPHAMVSTEEVRPLGPAVPVGDLLIHHAEAGIQLRVLPRLWELLDAVTTASLQFSAIRMRNARPGPDGQPVRRPVIRIA